MAYGRVKHTKIDRRRNVSMNAIMKGVPVRIVVMKKQYIIHTVILSVCL